MSETICKRMSRGIPQEEYSTGNLGVHLMLPGEIPGVETEIHEISGGGRHIIHSGEIQEQCLCFLLEGSGSVEVSGVELAVEKGTFLAVRPRDPTCYRSSTDSRILVIKMKLRHDDIDAVRRASYPFLVRYEDCEKYRDYFKSEKTVSRTIVHPFTLPRFCMGSVQTTGVDRIEPHAHPMLDQLFYSFPENDCTLLVDGGRYPFKGNTLLHVPLGSSHGIEAREGDVVHYLWIDFFESSEEMEYLVKIHKPVP